MKKRTFFTILVAVFLAVTLASFSYAAEKIKVGFVMPLTGGVAYTGNLIKKGADLAVEEINAKGGVNGAQIELIPYDSRCAPKEGVAATQRLIEKDRVKFVLGCVCSHVTLSMMPITEENKVIHINFSYSPKITQMGYNFTFRDAPGSAITIPPLTDYLVGKKKVKSWSVLVINNDYGRGDGDEFADGVRRNGGKIVSYDVIEWGTTDFYPFITKIKGYKPEGIRITEYESSGIGFVKQLRQLGFKGVFSACDLIINDMPLKQLGKLADGIYGETVYEPDLYAASKAFDKVYFTKFKEHSQRNNAMGYSAVDILARAMTKAKTTTDTGKIAQAMKQLRYEQVWGPAYYDGKGQLQMNAYVVKVKDGKREIVYPK